MAASIEQKVDYLLKKIGYTASKTGIAEDESLSGTKKAPFAEALPSPLVVPATSIYGQSELIPSTPPGATSGVVEVYGTTSAFQMTEDNTVSGKRSWLARAVQGNNSSDMVGDWIDTQFGSDYIINVYAGDPNSGGTKLSAAGSGSNDTWFFDYSSGVLNFNGDAAPTAVTGGADIYLVGYRYTGLKGTSGADGSFTEVIVSGVATFSSDINANGNIIGDGATNISGIDSVTAASYYLQDGANPAQNVFTVSGTDVSLNGVDAIDATTKATLEASLAIAPNEFTDIVVSGLSTFNGTVDLNADIIGSGDITYTGIGSITAGIATFGQATLGSGSTITGIGYIESLRVENGAEISGVTTFKGDVVFEGNSITGTIENAERAYRLDAPLTTGTNNVSFALPLVETPGLDTSFVTTQEVTYNPATGILTAPSANFSENVNVVGVLTAGTLYVNNPLEDVVITNAIITGIATVAGDFEAQSNVQIDGNLTIDGTLVGTAVSATTLTASGEVEGGSLDINGNGDISGNLNVGGDLTIAGTLAYEDVTNIDSVGLITARTGIDVLANGINVQAGVVTSTDGFEGDLTGDVIGNVTGNLTGEVNAPAFDTNADGVVVTGIATATGFSGPLVGDVTGNLTGEVNAAAFDTNADGIVVTGVATATAFVGDGSGLTNIDAALNGQDVSVRHAQVGGALTVTGATDLNGDLDVDGLTNLDEVNIAGVATGVQFNIGNTAVLETVNGQVSLSGIATLDATTKATIEREIALAPNDFASLNITGLSTFAGLADFNGGIDVAGGSTSDELNVTGVATVGGAFDVNGGADLSGGVLVDVLGVTGVATVAGNLLANANLDVTNHTTLNTLRATGLSTFVDDVQIDGDLTANGDITGDGATNITGINSVTATEFYGDGSNLTGLEAGLDGLNVTLGDVTVGGALTVTGDTDLNGGLDVDGHTEVDNFRASGVSTFVGGATFEENLAILGQGSIQTLVVAGNSSLQATQIGAGLTVTGLADLNGAVSVAGTSEFNDVVRINDTLFANGAVEVADGQGLTVGNIFSVDSNGESPIFSVDIEADFNEGINVDGEVGGNAGILTTGDLAGTIAGLDIAPRHINASGVGTFAGAIDANGGLDVAGGATLDTLTVTGNTTLGDASSDTVSFVASVGTGLTPSANATHDLGANELRFANVYGGQFIGTSVNVSDDVTIGGNLSVGGTITAVDIVDLQIISPVVELGLESVGDGTLQPPSDQTLYNSGIAMWYNRVGVSSTNAQAAAMFADIRPTGTYRIGFATDVSFSGYGTTDSISSVNGWAEIEAGGLWMNDCAGQSVVINCTGTERFLNNITVDGGTF